MFRYSSDEGFLYARDLFSLFLASDYSMFSSDKIELTEREFKDVLKTREFKEFLIKRENDYASVSDLISEKSFDYDDGFGKTLEINPGKYEVIVEPDLFNFTESSILTMYNDPLFFTHEEDVHFGSIDFLKMISKDSTKVMPIIKSREKLSVSEYDTIIYLVKPELNTMLNLLKYASDSDKIIITGLVTNVFDKKCEEKVDAYEDIYKRIDGKIPGYYEMYAEENGGTVVRLIHTMNIFRK